MATITFYTTCHLTISDIMLLSQCGRNTARKIKNLINEINQNPENSKPTLKQYQDFYNEPIRNIEIEIKHAKTY